MSYQEEERQIRLRRQQGKQAIALAMQGQWQEAIAANKKIIENFPHDVEAYNRLGRAYMELGNYAQAREAYGRAVELDRYNAIANRNGGGAGFAYSGAGVEYHKFARGKGDARGAWQRNRG